MSLWVNSEQGGPVATHCLPEPIRLHSIHKQDFAAANVDIKAFDEYESLTKQKQGRYFVFDANTTSVVTKLAHC